MSREVELIIRAKDEASKFVDSITDSLKALTSIQDDVGQSAQKTGSLLDKLGKEFRDLNDEAKRLASLGKVAQGLERSATAVKTLGDSVGKSASELSTLSRESQEAANKLTSLRGALDAEEDALKGNIAARKQASKELTEANRAVAAAERNQERYNKALGDTPDQFVRPAARSAAAFIAGDVEASRATQARLSQEVKQYTADVEASRAAVQALKPQVQALDRQQSSLADQTEKASGALNRNLDTLERGRTEYTGIKQSAEQASVAMGGMAVTQEQVAKSSARVAAEIARTKAQIEGLSKTPRATSSIDVSADTKETAARRAAIEQLRSVTKALTQAQAESQRLNAAFRSSTAPTEEMGRAAGQSSVRVRELKTELADLRTRLRASEGGFKSWSQSVTTVRTATAGTAQSATQIGLAANAAAAGLRPLGSAAQGVSQGLGSASNAGNGFRSALNGIYGDSRKALSLMQRVRGEVLALATAYVGLQAAISNIGGVINAFQTLEAAQSRLGSVFNNDSGKTTQELEFLQRQADRLGVQFGTLADQYSKFAVAANTANFTLTDTRKIFLSVAEAARVNRLSQDQLEGVFKAIEQMISKGCHAPGTMIRMADGSARKVENIGVGDTLMGPDGKPRVVLMLASGTEEMFEVLPSKGNPFVVNRHHKLRVTRDGKHETMVLADYLALMDKSEITLVHSDIGSVTFETRSVGVGRYHGFLISGDHLYLDAQGFEHHNTVSAEELRGQLGDRMSGAFQIFASAIGVTTAELDKMMKEGEVIANSSNLVKFANELDKRFGSQLAEALRGTTAEIGRFSNNLFQAQLLVGQGGFIESFTNALRRMNTYFQSREGRDFFLALGAALAKFTDALAQVPKYFEQIKLGLEVFAAVKVAGVLTNLIGSIKAMGVAAIGAANSLTAIGPPTQQMVQQQTALGRALGTTVGQLGTWQRSLTAAGGGLRTVGAVLGGLRTVVITMTGLFRGLWAAIGGLPGIILTGVTVAIGQWATQIDSATSALDEHQRQMQAVIAAYEQAKGKAVDWGTAVKGVTISQAEDNLGKLIDSYNEKFDDLRSKARGVQGVLQMLQGPLGQRNRSTMDPADIDNMEGLINLLNQLEQKKVTLEQFRQGLDLIARSTKQKGLKDLAVDMQNFLNIADENGTSLDTLSNAIEKTQARIRLLKGESTDADKALLGLKESSDAAKESTNDLDTNAAKINEAFGEMGKLISKTSDELKRLETINGLDKQYQDALKLARTMGQVMGLTDQYNKALNGAIEGSITGNSGIVDRIIGIESGGNAAAKNPDSSATGLGQFIESTWLRMFKEYFPDRAAGLTDAMILELRKNATVSREMVALYVQENAKILKQAGVAVTDANLYLAHFLGPGGATKVLSAGAGTKLSDVLGQDAINANPSILGGGKTVDDLVAWAQKKVGISQAEANVQKELVELDQKRTEKATEYNTDLENRLSLQENENANAGRLTQEAFVQKKLAEEQKKAKEAGVVLGDAQIERIKTAAAEEYKVSQEKRDQKASTQEANIALQQAVALNQQRNALQQQFNAAQKAGDVTQAQGLQQQLTDVNTRLQEAIEKAREMWTAIGGEQADVALTKLDTLKVKADSAGNSLTFLGLSTQQVAQLGESFADGLVGVFDSFAQAIANGENAMQALGRAFLQFAADFLRQIAQMILKQLILNALQSFGIPGLGAAHTGGRVGAGFVGSGNARRGPAIGAQFIRYHTGGVAGLRPNEVPTILEEGEEVLTKQDPRHRDNGGMNVNSGGTSGGEMPIRIVNVLNDDVAEQIMNSATGERVFLAHAKKNAATLRQMVSR